MVLDDDPTGTQTVHDVPVLTEWSAPALQAELAPASRSSLSSPTRAACHCRGPGAECRDRAQPDPRRPGCRDFAVVSRSDSTLRGHYPGEVDVLAEGLGQRFDATLIIPFFLEGVATHLTTSITWQKAMRSSPRRRRPSPAMPLSAIVRPTCAIGSRKDGRPRRGGCAGHQHRAASLRRPGAAGKALMELADGAVCVVNAAEMRDMEVFVSGLLDAEESGKRFLYRTAASFVQARAGIAPLPLLGPNDLSLPAEGGAPLSSASTCPRRLRRWSACWLEPASPAPRSTSPLCSTTRTPARPWLPPSTR